LTFVVGKLILIRPVGNVELVCRRPDQEVPMPADYAATSLGATYLAKNGRALSERAPVVVIGADLCCAGEMPSAQRSALAAADVVLLEGDVEPTILGIVPPSTFVEPVAPPSGHPALTRVSGIARARKLASEGWRVVWLVAGDAEGLARNFPDAGILVGDRGATDAVAAAGREPHLLATSLNGLAG
jgi:hypothetical protein